MGQFELFYWLRNCHFRATWKNRINFKPFEEAFNKGSYYFKMKMLLDLLIIGKLGSRSNPLSVSTWSLELVDIIAMSLTTRKLLSKWTCSIYGEHTQFVWLYWHWKTTQKWPLECPSKSKSQLSRHFQRTNLWGRQ